MKRCLCAQHKGRLVSYQTLARCKKKRARLESPSSDSDRDSEDHAEEGSRVAEEFAREIVEMVAHGRVGVTGVNEVLKIVNEKYQAHMPGGLKIPKSWYKVRALAVNGEQPVYTIRDLCEVCDFMYAKEDTEVRKCPQCSSSRWKKNGTPSRFAVYFDLGDAVRRKFSSKYLFDNLIEQSQRPKSNKPIRDRFLESAFDGNILHGLPPNPEGVLTLCLSVTADGVEVEENVSYTPVTARILNLDVAVASLFSSILLLGYFPPKVQSYQNLFKPIAQAFASYMPGNRTIQLTCKQTGREIKAHILLAYMVNDLRGAYLPICGRCPPAYVGSCVRCHQKGFRRLGRTILPGAPKLN